MWSDHGTVWKFKSREWVAREKTKIVESKIPRKILMMDLDGTVIVPSSGKKFPKDANDWKWRMTQVPAIIRKYSKTCTIIFVTNQSGMSNKRKKNLAKAQEDFKTKVKYVAQELGIPLLCYVATANDIYRKPSPLIFEDYVQHDTPGIDKITYVMYIGDAAGRDGDFADSDRKFAANIALNVKNCPKYIDDIKPKVAFQTPEQFFLKLKPESYKYSGFDPGKFLNGYKKDSKVWNYLELIQSTQKQELILMVGPPASGKSQLSKLLAKEWPNYVRFSQDDHKGKTLRLVKEALIAGDSVIVDNNHGTRISRDKYINAIQKENLPVRVIMTMGYSGAPSEDTKLDLSKKTDRKIQIDMAKHMNIVREKKNARAGYKTPSKWIPNVVYNTYNSRFEYPKKSEGISEIIQIPFIPKFHNNRDLITFLERT